MIIAHSESVGMLVTGLGGGVVVVVVVAVVVVVGAVVVVVVPAVVVVVVPAVVVVVVGAVVVVVPAVVVVVVGGTNGPQVGTVIVSVSVVTVEPKAKALPWKLTVLPKVILRPAAVPRKIFPTKLEFAPIVVPPTGAQNTSVAQAPPATTTLELAAEPSAPPGLKM
jgi:hypothetical protein